MPLYIKHYNHNKKSHCLIEVTVKETKRIYGQVYYIATPVKGKGSIRVYKDSVIKKN